MYSGSSPNAPHGTATNSDHPCHPVAASNSRHPPATDAHVRTSRTAPVRGAGAGRPALAPATGCPLGGVLARGAGDRAARGGAGGGVGGGVAVMRALKRPHGGAAASVGEAPGGLVPQ